MDEVAVALKELLPEILLFAPPASPAEHPIQVVAQLISVPLPKVVISRGIPSQEQHLDRV